jgi:transcription antitermination factor NusG
MNQSSVSSSQSRWYMLQTKPHQETRVLAALRREHYTSLLPMLRADNGRQVSSNTEPLFPRYLFVQCDNAGSALASVRRIEGVTGFLRLHGEYATVPDNLVAALLHTCPMGGAAAKETWTPSRSSQYPVFDSVHDYADGATRALALVELICQPRHPSVAANPLRRAA